VQTHAASVSSIDPANTDFSDLNELGKAIGDARILMLGEQDHGDAPAFLAKTRLIKYLHEKKGFNVLAFESDFFALNTGWEQITKPTMIDSFLKKNIFPVWTLCNTCSLLLYDYIPKTWKTANPLTVTGFDSQLILEYSRHNLSRQLDSVLRSLNLPIIHQSNYASEIIPLIDSLKFWYMETPKSKSSFVLCGNYLSQIREQAADKLPQDSYWMMIIDNLIQWNRGEQGDQKIDSSGAAFNVRDYEMAKNLKWLTTVKFQKEKIIVWAANYHVSRHIGETKNTLGNVATTMGWYFCDDPLINEQTYILGFDSYEGLSGRVNEPTYKVASPKAKSFENWIDKSAAYAFVDFKAYNEMHPNSNEQFYLKGIGHYNKNLPWNHLFDGIFFIRQVYPCNR
ncbi:MAG: erythromycin esterase family protein, partial [Flavisolibacter sp.]